MVTLAIEGSGGSEGDTDSGQETERRLLADSTGRDAAIVEAKPVLLEASSEGQLPLPRRLPDEEHARALGRAEASARAQREVLRDL